MGASEAILAVLEQVPGVQNSNEVSSGESPNALIAFQQVSKSYAQRTVLTAINFEIHPGEKVALIGESGAGKTTLLNVLLGFEQPTTGAVFLKGALVNKTDSTQAMAWVGQSAAIFHGSIKENIALAEPEASGQRINEAAVAAGVTEFTAALPSGLDTQIGERGYGLSGGQIQRIALARAFLKNADIVVLDEPTANLDSENKTRLLAVIEHLFKDKTLIIATHDPIVINRLTRQLVLKQGRLVG